MSENEYKPDEMEHPGVVVRAAIEATGITAFDIGEYLCKDIEDGLSIRDEIEAVCEGKGRITDYLALYLQCLNVGKDVWLKLQADYDEFLERKKAAEDA